MPFTPSYPLTISRMVRDAYVRKTVERDGGIPCYFTRTFEAAEGVTAPQMSLMIKGKDNPVHQHGKHEVAEIVSGEWFIVDPEGLALVYVHWISAQEALGSSYRAIDEDRVFYEIEIIGKNRTQVSYIERLATALLQWLQPLIKKEEE